MAGNSGGKNGLEYLSMCLRLWEKSPLFKGFSLTEVPSALQCLQAFSRQYEKGECVLDVEQDLDAAGILLEGTAYIHKDSDLGTRNLVVELGPGDMFGEAAVCAGVRKSPFRVLSATFCEVLYIRMDRVVRPALPVCPFRSRLVENLLRWISQKNLDLNEKLDTLSHRSLRDRIKSYLSRQARINGSSEFAIPFSRNDLADYLNVDRSALSRELCRMKKEGLIEFEKNRFFLSYLG